MLRLMSLKQHSVYAEARVPFHSGEDEMEKRTFEKREEKCLDIVQKDKGRFFYNNKQTCNMFLINLPEHNCKSNQVCNIKNGNAVITR